jgi:hypothetical protein
MRRFVIYVQSLFSIQKTFYKFIMNEFILYCKDQKKAPLKIARLLKLNYKY